MRANIIISVCAFTRYSDGTVTPWMKGRGGAAVTVSKSGRTLFVVAGFSGNENSDVYAYDLDADTWTQVGDAMLRPCSVTGISTLVIGGVEYVVVFGGEVEESTKGHEGAGGFTNELTAFRVAEAAVGETGAAGTPATSLTRVDVTVTKGDVPGARGWLGFTASGAATAVLFGGLTGNDDAPLRLNDLWSLTIA